MLGWTSGNIQNPARFADFESALRHGFLPDRRYLSLGVVGAVATTVGATIIVWVPGSEGEVIVHRKFEVRVSSAMFCFVSFLRPLFSILYPPA